MSAASHQPRNALGTNNAHRFYNDPNIKIVDAPYNQTPEANIEVMYAPSSVAGSSYAESCYSRSASGHGYVRTAGQAAADRYIPPSPANGYHGYILQSTKSSKRS